MNVWIKKNIHFVFFIYVLTLFGSTALFQDGLFERDGYFHARFAQMMPSRGLSQSFPWTQLSTWNERFCDKEFLFHLGMMPFSQIGKDPIFGARVFMILLSVAVLVALFLVLRANDCIWTVYFAGLPLATGGLFIARLGMIRSHVLSMLLLLVGVHLLLKQKWKPLFALGFIYSWSYTVPFVLVMTAVPFVIGKFIARGGLDWKSPLAAGFGVVVGLVIHPYSPLTFETFLTYIQVFALGMSGVSQTGFELGNEIYPYSLPVFFDIYPLILFLVPMLTGYAIFRFKKLSPGTLGLIFSALFWFGLTVAAPRFVEYSVLLLALACGFTVRDAWTVEKKLRAWLEKNNSFLTAVSLLTVAVLVGFHIRSMSFYYHYQTKAAPARYFTGACIWMEENLKPGETVINLFWDDFPELFYDGYRQYYLWGLDPTYSIRQDQTRAKLLEQYRQHKIRLNGHAMSRLFNSQYLVLRVNRTKNYPELNKLPFRKVYMDDRAVIYQID